MKKSSFQKSHQSVVAGYGTYVVETKCKECGSLLRSSKTGECVSCAKRAASMKGTEQYRKRQLIDRKLEEIRLQRELEQEYTTYAV